MFEDRDRDRLYKEESIDNMHEPVSVDALAIYDFAWYLKTKIL